MKKMMIFFIKIVFVLVLCGCSKNNIVDLSASLLLPQEAIAPYLEYTCTIKENTTRMVSTVEYRPIKTGKGDPVILKLYQENELLAKDSIKEQFDEAYEFRDDAFTIDSLGVESFVAYPSIHCYSDGYHIEITAGSGSDNDQKVLLMNLAKIALENLDEFVADKK